MIKESDNLKEAAHVGFEIGLLLKGIDGLLEMIGGMLLIFLNPQRLNHLIYVLTQHELSEDPKDLVANFLIMLGHSFSISAQQFGVIYLLSHGAIKLILIFLLLRKKLWSYPLLMVFLGLFIFYQMYRFTFKHSVFLILLTILDAAMIVLTYLEYKRLRSDLITRTSV